MACDQQVKDLEMFALNKSRLSKELSSSRGSKERLVTEIKKSFILGLYTELSIPTATTSWQIIIVSLGHCSPSTGFPGGSTLDPHASAPFSTQHPERPLKNTKLLWFSFCLKFFRPLWWKPSSKHTQALYLLFGLIPHCPLGSLPPTVYPTPSTYTYLTSIKTKSCEFP